MAAVPAVLTASADTTDGTSFTTASVSPTAGAALLCWVTTIQAAGTPVAPTMGGTLGATWTMVDSHAYSTATSTRLLSLWRASAGASPGSGTINFSGFAATTQTICVWCVCEVTGADTTTADGVVQSAKNRGTASPHTDTLLALGSASNIVIGGAAANQAAGTLVNEVGYTELSDQGGATPSCSISVQWNNAGDITPTWTFAAASIGSISVEVKASTSTTYTDSGTGTLTLTGSGTDSAAHTGSGAGTLTLSGTGVDEYIPPGGGGVVALGADGIPFFIVTHPS